MADEADLAQYHEDLNLKAALSKRKKVLTTIGACWYCDSRLGAGLLFCGSECAVDFEREERLKQIAGRGGRF